MKSADTSYLQELREQHITLSWFLQTQREYVVQQVVSEGVRMTAQIYINILEDALKTVTSLIEHLELKK